MVLCAGTAVRKAMRYDLDLSVPYEVTLLEYA